MDLYKATVISILPWEVNEQKPGVFPGRFHIDKAEDGEVSTLILSESTCYAVTDHDQNISVPVIQSALKMADSLVRDYIDAKLAVDENSKPGIMAVLGSYTPADAQATFPAEIKDLRTKQVSWFNRLVNIADDAWNRYHQHRAISDEQRFAASYLKQDKPWNVDVATLSTYVKCPACQQTISAQTLKCPHCQTVIKPAEYAALLQGGVVGANP